MNRARLEHLITVLQDVVALSKPFSLHYWAKANLSLIQKQHACGTTACACGYAGFDPVFQAQGLRLIDKDYTDCPVITTIAELNEISLSRSRSINLDIEYDGFVGWSAIRLFFELDMQCARIIFNEEEYPNDSKADAVIRRVQLLLTSSKDALIESMQIDRA